MTQILQRPEARSARHHKAGPTGGSLRRNIVAEFRRTFSVRGWLYQLMFALALPALGTLAYVTTIGKPGGMDIGTAQGVRAVLSSGFMAALLAGVLGAVSVTSEYRHRTIGATLLAAGRPHRWLLGKLVVVGLVGLLFSTLGQAVVLAIGVPGLRRRGVEPDLFSGELLRMSLGTAGLGFFCALWGAGIGLLVRHQVVAVAAMVIYPTMVEAALLAFVPDQARFLPGGLQAAIVSDPNAEYKLSILAGAALFTGWILLALAGGWLRLRRSDVPG